ncbi:MAG: cytochrome c oxidase subunit 3 [Acidobacteriaceae bacterium]|nr:cytochrome c oxidase subunit 3 [Acidobacteriaceae bacterium]
MTQARTLDVSHLPPYEISSQAPLWWGQICLVAIEATMFSILIASYFYVRLRMDVWPPPGDQFPHVRLPTLALITLIASALPAYWASEAAKKNDRRGMIVGLVLNLLLAMAAFVMRVIEWHSLNFNWKTDAQGSYVWAFLGLHSFDFVAGMVETLVLLIILLSGRYAEKQRLGVHVDSIVWYFVVAIWIPIYVVIYWGPRILETAQ